MFDGDQGSRMDYLLYRFYLDGDARTFSRFDAAARPHILRFIRGMGVPEQDAQDLAQCVMLTIFCSRDRCKWAPKPHSSLLNWLYRVSRNQVLDFRRAAYQRCVRPFTALATESAPGLSASMDHLPCAGPSPEEIVIRQQTLRDLNADLARFLLGLPCRDRLLITLWSGTTEDPWFGTHATLGEVSHLLQERRVSGTSVPSLSRRSRAVRQRMRHYFQNSLIPS